MSMYKVVPYEAARIYSIVVLPKSVPLNNRKFSRCAIVHRESTSNKAPSYTNLRGGFTNPLNREGEDSLKLRFFDQTKHMAYEIKHFYQDFIGNKEVQESQRKVHDLQHKLNILIDKRSSCEFEVIEIKKQLAELNSSQQTVSREDAQYIELLKQEFKLHSEKQRLDSLIEVMNYEHQLMLMQLTHAFNDVHLKERQEANNIRLVKLFLTTIVAVLGF
uniref:Uncharacterized protein n=1 Tax=Anopheles funestus TaxID=62324 RepID=A0A4Y0BPW4_ANOFN